MNSSFTIKAKLLLISLVAIIVVSIAIAFESIYSVKKLSNKDIENFRKSLLPQKRMNLKTMFH